MKSKDVLKVIENFESVLSLAQRDNNLNMAEVRICDEDHACGTTHCHGGWYGIALLKQGQTLRKWNDTYISFTEGADAMARDLGFTHKFSLSKWLEENPKVWGNVFGNGIFSNPSAFEGKKRPLGAKNLQHIIDHWREVYDRLVILEENDREDITTKLAILPVDETLDTIKTQVYETI